ncbi:MAG TPA: hypothetical protein VKA46_16120 [Gemmataceae bacterium]|nr:hypothetical protein [Gemmataceae bacterium]
MIRRLPCDLGHLVFTFAELAGYFAALEKAFEGWDMTESKVVNRWMEEAARKERIATLRENLLELVQARFPASIPAEVIDLIGRQDSQDLLKEWFRAAISAPSAEQFLSVIRR